MKISQKQVMLLIDLAECYINLLRNEGLTDEGSMNYRFAVKLVNEIKSQQSEDLINLDEAKPTSSCCSAHAGSEEECK